MADILISGMEMPEYCYECPLHNMVGGYCQFYKDSYRWSFERPASCPLVPLPEGHGKLVDADAIMTNLGDVLYKGSVRRVLMSAPTIVPAEGGGEE